MNDTKSSFLADLESELTKDTAPTPAKRRSRRPKALAYLATALALSGSLVLTHPTPAAASTCSAAMSPSPVTYSHTKYCGMGTYGYTYLKTVVYYSSRTACYYFHAYAFMCSLTAYYDRGTMYACKTYL